MRQHPIPPFDQNEPRNRVCVADGYGIKLHVRNGHLVIEDGVGRNRRTRRFHKATAKLDRVVLTATSGYVTLEAIRWLTDAAIGLIHLDRDGNLLTSSAAPVGHNPRMRRAQALAATSPIGIEITRRILRRKITGQANVASNIDTRTSSDIQATLFELDTASTLDELRLIEATAALVYWGAWAVIPVRFVQADIDRIPDHWHTIGPRRSPISGNQRRAATPAQAILNYLYALLEGEARIACATAGLDPAIGILHADQPYRDSLAFDVMEPARPLVDRYTLDLLLGHTFRRDDFYETSSGSCRINRQLAHTLAATSPTWRKAVATTIEELTKTLDKKKRPSPRPTATRLTQANRQAGRDDQRRRVKGQPRQTTPRPDSNCSDCGSTIPSGHKRCTACNDRYQALRMPDVAKASWDQRRNSGIDPAHGGKAAAKRGATQARRSEERRRWEAANDMPTESVFTKEILPTIADIPVRVISNATGLSTGYCSKIRKGDVIPHPMHWESLRASARI